MFKQDQRPYFWVPFEDNPDLIYFMRSLKRIGFSHFVAFQFTFSLLALNGVVGAQFNRPKASDCAFDKRVFHDPELRIARSGGCIRNVQRTPKNHTKNT
jgi:hypothetical protein